jgi:hypothetical protein
MRKYNPGRTNDLGRQKHIIALVKRVAKIAEWLIEAKMAGEAGGATSRGQISAKNTQIRIMYWIRLETTRI